MKIKVCGMRDAANIRELGRLPLDWMGFIFYPRSPRYAGEMQPEAVRGIPRRIRKAGVFVNASVGEIRETVCRYGLDTVQLHGDESPGMCAALREEVEVVKAFSLSDEGDLRVCPAYAGCCDYFVFDTKTLLYGGSGRQYDWSVLSAYTGRTPFLLSGGIGPEDAARILAFSHPMLAGIDLNSRFEERPGLKNIAMIEKLVKELRYGNE